MNIKCPECGNENQLGAIFCRNCGAKLDIESIRPTVKDNKIGGGMAGLVQRLITILILIAVLGLIAALFLPFGLKPYTPASEDAAKAAGTKMDILNLKLDGGRGPAQHGFTTSEAMALFNSTFLQKSEDAAAGYQVENVLLDVTSSSELVVGIDTKLFGKVPVRFELVGKPTVVAGENGVAPVVGFDITSASMGHVTMPVDLLKSRIAEKFVVLTQGKDMQRILKAVKNIEIDTEGNIVLTFAEAPKAAPAAAAKK